MSLNSAIGISVSGLSAQRTRMEAIASNLANSETTRTPGGGPYRRRIPIFRVEQGFGDSTGTARGVKVERVLFDDAPPIIRFEPGHPDADADGRVAYPNVDPVREMVDMMSATRSYEANITALKSVRQMKAATLDIAR